MDLILGVDGGQSSTIALLADETGLVLGVGHGGPANHIHEPGGVQRMENSLRDAVHSAFASAGLPLQRVASACFGMTGGMELATDLAPRFVQADALTVHHDVVTALAGASRGGPGVILISGTGAIAYGQTIDGRTAKVDGAGYLFGDEGGGYWIGVRALNAFARAVDGRGPDTALARAIPEAFGQADFAGVHRVVYDQTAGRPEIASLAAVVGAAAASGDAVAQAILVEAGALLAESALVAVRRLSLADPPIYYSGGVFEAGRWLLDSFSTAIHHAVPQATIKPAAFPQVVGALILAQQPRAALTDAFYQTLEQSLPAQVLRKRRVQMGQED